ncbi:class I SAM-dependent methyltransferase [Pseudalkalibacillus sp. SCS-8]|uniref:class I SAM-dependent methyltransferase n=1 Tax=Pseudalkalibacillus nanhaiensis TaxID=3115291 RepID=UPI0032DA8CFF
MNGEEFDQLVSFFDGMARTSWLSAVHDQLKKQSGSWKDARVLDIGCGTGRLLLKGVEEAKHLTGVDLSSEMVKASQQNFFLHNRSDKSTFLVADAYELPFEDGHFDVALSTCVMFLLPEPEIGLKEMIRVTKKGGTITMLNPSMKMNQMNAFEYSKKHHISGFEQTTLLKWSNVSTRRHRYSEEDMISLLSELGAERVKNTEVLDGLAMITSAEV